MSKESAVKETEKNEIYDDTEEILIKNKIQLGKEPKRGILKELNKDETQTEYNRWRTVEKLMTFLGLNDCATASYIKQISKKNF